MVSESKKHILSYKWLFLSNFINFSTEWAPKAPADANVDKQLPELETSWMKFIITQKKI